MISKTTLDSKSQVNQSTVSALKFIIYSYMLQRYCMSDKHILCVSQSTHIHTLCMTHYFSFKSTFNSINLLLCYYPTIERLGYSYRNNVFSLYPSFSKMCALKKLCTTWIDDVIKPWRHNKCDVITWTILGSVSVFSKWFINAFMDIKLLIHDRFYKINPF